MKLNTVQVLVRSTDPTFSKQTFTVNYRLDTYLYNDLNFMNRCNATLYAEYPKLTIFGELWVHGVPSQSYAEQTSKFTTAIDVLSSNSFDLSTKTKIPTKTMWVLELKK
ncbi:MAG: cyclomaltodextrinase C-terminal domain-containing protein [Chryseotalea sp. WA131a]|jgi:hypothetical protein|nr:MAG: cyclomaltodextrinase C-terminal domain-containing protein [Chryseotalea sp. WA131a]